MPVRWGGANTIAVAEGQGQTATVQNGKCIVSDSGDLILIPGLCVAICRRVDQHEHALRTVECLMGSAILRAEIDSRFFRYAAIAKQRVELAGIIGFEEDIVVIKVETRAASLDAPGECG